LADRKLSPIISFGKHSKKATREKNFMFRTLILATALALPAVGAHASLRALYTFEGNFNDVSGNALHAVAGGVGPVFATGFEGQGASFNGLNDYLTVALDVNPSAMPAMTWGAWVAPTDASPIRQVLSHDNGGFDRSIGIDSRGAAGTGFAAFNGVGVSRVGGEPALGSWTFLAARYDQSSGAMTFWVNDASVSLTSNFGSGNSFLRIASNPAFVEYFAGSIDNVFIFDQALSDSQIASIRTGGAAAVMAVPEPEVAALMLGGLAVVGWAARRRRPVVPA